ncbi:Aminopeptidase N [Arsenophonus endosymbiont of Bemisia tabaci Q2]|nr:Aminopeptidase N [Arsenophonus endosymbiont of Bemisia tabaci Q2]
MTDAMAALSAAVAAQLPTCQQLMAEFEQCWRHDGLIMDKWFMLQATSPAKNVLSTQYVLYLLIRHLVWRIPIEYVL